MTLAARGTREGGPAPRLSSLLARMPTSPCGAEGPGPLTRGRPPGPLTRGRPLTRHHGGASPHLTKKPGPANAMPASQFWPLRNKGDNTLPPTAEGASQVRGPAQRTVPTILTKVRNEACPPHRRLAPFVPCFIQTKHVIHFLTEMNAS